jgi:hypothetical protein
MCVHVHHTHTQSSVQLFQKSKCHLKSRSVRWVKLNKQHTQDLQITGTTLQNLVARVTWHPEIVHPYAYTECFRGNLSNCKRIFLRSRYNDVTKHTWSDNKVHKLAMAALVLYTGATYLLYSGIILLYTGVTYLLYSGVILLYRCHVPVIFRCHILCTGLLICNDNLFSCAL